MFEINMPSFRVRISFVIRTRLENTIRSCKGRKLPFESSKSQTKRAFAFANNKDEDQVRGQKSRKKYEKIQRGLRVDYISPTIFPDGVYLPFVSFPRSGGKRENSTWVLIFKFNEESRHSKNKPLHYNGLSSVTSSKCKRSVGADFRVELFIKSVDSYSSIEKTFNTKLL
jgi:hypothetical protein